MKKIIGYVGVDSGQVMICDPTYIECEWNEDTESKFSDHAHDIYEHVKDKSLWQYTYGKKPAYLEVNKFPGSYSDIIPKYKKSPNQLKEEGLFVIHKLDPRPHIPDGEFSYRGICKITTAEDQAGQLNYKMGHAGVAVASAAGWGDGHYPVEATYKNGRVQSLTIKFF